MAGEINPTPSVPPARKTDPQRDRVAPLKPRPKRPPQDAPPEPKDEGQIDTYV